MAEPDATAGQATTSDPAGTTGAAPQGDAGQSASPNQTTTTGPDGGKTESFFDPKSIEGKPELEAAYKQMQSAFTKKNQRFKESQQKIDAYDSFISDPMGTMKQLAQQYGYSLVQGNPESADGDDSPKTWADVYERAKQEVLKDLQPALGELQQIKQQNVEQYLDSRHADWRTYEDDMLELLKVHPSLANDPDKLYKLSVPGEVLEERAVKMAMEKLKGAGESSEISGASPTHRETTSAPEGIKSFNDAVVHAKAKLAKMGIKPLGA